jgi:DNA ligase 1
VPPPTLIDFARVKDAVASVAGKLEKQRLLADYFRAIEDDHDLRLAVRFAAGRAFAATDERVLAVGGAIVWDVLLHILPIDHDELRRLTIASGEIGEALSNVWPQHDVERPLTLHDLSEAFDQLAATGVQERKRALLLRLFQRCGTGREATYLAKIIFRDMRTGAQEGVLQAAVAQAFDRKLAEIQRCQLLVGNLEEVALLARHDQLCCAKFCLFHPIQFMLATPQETPADAARTMAGRPFFAEDKLDGIRAQVHKQGDRVAIYTRTMDRTDDAFPEVVEAMKRIDADFLIDGEIVPFAAGAVSPFQHLQRRLGRKKPSAAVLKKYPVTIVAFDLLYENGDLLMDRPLRERRARLDALVETLSRHHGRARLRPSLSPRSQSREGEAPSEPLQSREGEAPSEPSSPSLGTPGEGRGEGLPEISQPPLVVTHVHHVTIEPEIAAAFDAAKSRRNEGLILKDPDSIYAPGRRGKMWLKIKTHLPTLDCVVTAAEYGHGKRRGVLSDYTFAVWDADPAAGGHLVNIGKAYSGCTDEEIAQLTETFLGLSRGRHGHVHVVEPKIVLEIACDQIQKSGRHGSGFALRFPRIKRIRWDKRPEDADRLSRIAEIYESHANTARGHATENSEVMTEPTLFDGLA